MGTEMIEHSKEAEALDRFHLLNPKKERKNNSEHHVAASHQPEGESPNIRATVSSWGAAENNPQEPSANPSMPTMDNGMKDLNTVIAEGTK